VHLSYVLRAKDDPGCMTMISAEKRALLTAGLPVAEVPRKSDSRSGLLYHLDEDSTSVLRNSDFAGKVDASALDSIVRLQPKNLFKNCERMLIPS